MKPVRCFTGPGVATVEWHLSSEHALLHAKVGLFGLIRGALPIFSQVPVLLNQELDSCFPWQTQGPACPELPLLDGGVGEAWRFPREEFSHGSVSSLKALQSLSHIRKCARVRNPKWTGVDSRYKDLHLRVDWQTWTDIFNILFIITLVNSETSPGIKEEPHYKSSCRWRSLLPDRLRSK